MKVSDLRFCELKYFFTSDELSIRCPLWLGALTRVCLNWRKWRRPLVGIQLLGGRLLAATVKV